MESIMSSQIIIAIDGHDGSGKTTISKLLAETIKGKYIKPFSNDIGDLITWSAKNDKIPFLEELAFNAIEYTIATNPDERILIFDRHWLSIATLLPENKILQSYLKPVTILCWANIETTTERLFIRNDNKDDVWDNQKFCDLYYKLGSENNALIIDTSDSPNPEDIVNNIIAKLGLSEG